MPLASGEMKASFSYSLSKDNPGFSPTTSGKVKSKRIPFGTAYDQALTARYTISAAATQVLDLSSFTNEVGEAVTGTKAVGILLLPTGSTARIEEDGTDGLRWFALSDDGNGAVTVPSGGFFAYGEPTGTTIDATHKRLKITNTGGTSLTVDVVIFVKD